MYLRPKTRCMAVPACGSAIAKSASKRRLPLQRGDRGAVRLLSRCGQSRTTVRARGFAALIGRLWIGGI
jgi:hypothetical protein